MVNCYTGYPRLYHSTKSYSFATSYDTPLTPNHASRHCTAYVSDDGQCNQAAKTWDQRLRYRYGRTGRGQNFVLFRLSFDVFLRQKMNFVAKSTTISRRESSSRIKSFRDLLETKLKTGMWSWRMLGAIGYLNSLNPYQSQIRRSSVVEKILLNAQESGKKFSVIVIDSPPLLEGLSVFDGFALIICFIFCRKGSSH